MSDRGAIDNLFRARDPSADRSGARIWAHEARQIVDELRAPDAETGKPEGEFSDTAVKLMRGDIFTVAGREVEGARPDECSAGARDVLGRGLAEAAAHRWSGPTARTATLPARNGHTVFLTTGAGFAVDATGTKPHDVAALGNQLYHAGEWVQSNFGTSHNLFSAARLDPAGKRAVLAQFEAALAADTRSFNTAQRDQLLGNVAGLIAELIKSVDMSTPVATDRTEQRALIDAGFETILKAIDDPRLSPPIKHQLVGYLAGSESFREPLTNTQRAEIDDRFSALNPKFPFDYDAWDRAGKSNIRVDHIAGLGEGFLYGFSQWMQERGLGNSSWRNGENVFSLVRGDPVRGPIRLEATISASDPLNAWGRDMKVEIDGRSFRHDMFSGLGKPEVDITGYDGHSNFGQNTLGSMPTAPAQDGPKLLYRWVCAGVDAENAIAQHAPEAYANSYTTQDSGYFRKRSGPPEVGEYAYESEGWEAIRCLIRGVLGKKSHAQIQDDMKDHANWWGHSPGNDNNCVGPGDRRRGGSLDWDNDGIPNMFDLMPSVNTFDVAASVAREFELTVPDAPANEIKGDRAFQAIQFVNTATNYNSYLKNLNLNRRINAHPEGVWFDGRTAPREYVRFSPGPDGTLSVQLNSALSDMTMETLRAVLFYETARHLLKTDRTPVPSSQADQVAAALLFGASALAYDASYRDRPVFEGLKQLYGIPAAVDYRDIQAAVNESEHAHDYTGNLAAVRSIVSTYASELGQPGVGEPAIDVLG